MIDSIALARGDAMLKKNLKEAVERNKKFLKREMTNGILFKAVVKENPYAVTEDRDRSWIARPPLSITDKEWVIEDCRRNARIYRDIDDDTIPEGYPTLHFGESVYSYLLGGNVHFVGSKYHTCSGADPLIFTEADLDKLTGFEHNERVKAFTESAEYFAKEAKGDFWLKYFIAIDALNLAVELLGTTEAYLMVGEDDRGLMRKIMEFGVGFNYWFYTLQKNIYRENNKSSLYDDEFYELYDKTWYSIDAYDLCDARVYESLGFDYQQELINRVGGGMLHTHGTGLTRLLPYISRLKGLSVLQCGRDLYSQERLGFECLRGFREAAGDMPLRLDVSEEEFIRGIRDKTLPGGAEYTCFVKDTDTANRLADMAKEYRL